MVGDTVIPARGGKGREMLDSVFLLNYARRMEGRARWMALVHAAVGAVFGYGVGSVVLLVHTLLGGLGGFMPLMALAHHEAAVEVSYWAYVPIVTAAVFGGLWSMRGMAKSDEIRFQSQMALHVLKLQELALQERGNV